MSSISVDSIDNFKGKLSNSKLGVDSLVYKRAQYIELIMNAPEEEWNHHTQVSKNK